MNVKYGVTDWLMKYSTLVLWLDFTDPSPSVEPSAIRLLLVNQQEEEFLDDSEPLSIHARTLIRLTLIYFSFHAGHILQPIEMSFPGVRAPEGPGPSQWRTDRQADGEGRPQDRHPAVNAEPSALWKGFNEIRAMENSRRTYSISCYWRDLQKQFHCVSLLELGVPELASSLKVSSKEGTKMAGKSNYHIDK